jgi:predicted nucleic acid-binding protein
MSSKRKLLFDTHAFLSLFNREVGSEIIKDLMSEVQKGVIEGFVATITLTELAYIYSHRSDKALATLRVMQILHSKISAIPLTAEIAIQAGILKKPGIPVADAIIGASALSVQATVVTQDPHFADMNVPVLQYP